MKKIFTVCILSIFFLSCKKTQLDATPEDVTNPTATEKLSPLNAIMNNLSSDC